MLGGPGKWTVCMWLIVLLLVVDLGYVLSARGRDLSSKVFEQCTGYA